MHRELSTTPANSQAITPLSESAWPTRANFSFVMLVLTALIWGGPIILSIYIPVCLIEFLFPKSSSARKSLRQFRKKIFSRGIFIYLKMQSWFDPYFELAELRKLEATGEKFLLVSNHRSHLDVFLFISQIDGLQLLAKRSLFYVPVLGMMMRLTRQIPAEKGDFKSLDQATQTIRTRLQRNERVLIFPEFTRCPPGSRSVKSFSLLPFQIAMQENIKILPLVVSGTDDIWPKGSIFLRASNRKQKVVALQPIDAREFSSVDELRTLTQRRVNQKLAEEYNEA
jgi:1-acyl-sn-glycerol-3-phosphate acyltransferase